jgi:hypothetical protein
MRSTDTMRTVDEAIIIKPKDGKPLPKPKPKEQPTEKPQEDSNTKDKQ